MKKVFVVVLACLLFLGSSNVGFAADEATEKKPLQKINTTEYKVNDDVFELITWKDEHGSKVYTVPTKVKNKLAVAEYVNNIIEKENNKEKILPLGVTYPWTRNISGSSTDSRINWKISGYNEVAYFYPITENTMVVQAGLISTHYTGPGNPDQIVVSYSYTFKGLGISLSYPPELTKEETKISWTSRPVLNEWYVATDSLRAEAGSRVHMDGVEIETSSDVYKGSYIYRPRVSEYISWTER
ncbi:hypothetical protein M5W83_20870 [Paenibacillus thiaminolyticus]|uniref:Uncharacterized protein n=1 Tax=Paenibacillus thiaminolyticus TaxID=49283 RepID=A0AAP9DV64_PANTH|nr:hypothetical protein [Paenibacillus thiaminolyticus]MCY9534926.1 hypothetical protein [Paenibacillus thiaminolyticus]MCY9604296.1 hypothetical protein [Paenibacillus thiaminolyticus]MCY9609606.1 hypothetical protein [Paenibacillus thiaminolyticus]MCY9612444.1 hypothetical protein [Paenibacillus thiaminolyticus]MCY9617425.1 hypothetical protein [Paenibacillus thiaminolyticus]